MVDSILKNGSLLISCLIIILNSCGRQKPTQPDGTIGNIQFMAIDTSASLPINPQSGIAPLPRAKLRLYSNEYAQCYEYLTDENGTVRIDNILAASYQISVDKIVPAAFWLEQGGFGKDVMFCGGKELALFQSKSPIVDTIKCARTELSGLVINEIYYCGPPESGFYYFDQFVELYNASTSTIFLDGLIICRAANSPIYPDEFAEATYAYQFPGNGREYPVPSGEFVVIAQDAIDHVHTGGARGSLDLTLVDWEFYTERELDIDNPAVPNLRNVNPNKAVDFLLNMKKSGVLLVKVPDINQVPFTANGNHIFHFSEVIDGVEYSEDRQAAKDLNPCIDTGCSGNSIMRYSGKSIERAHPETGEPGYDTNNSTFDFYTLSRPTPGRQHRADERMP